MWYQITNHKKYYTTSKLKVNETINSSNAPKVSSQSFNSAISYSNNFESPNKENPTKKEFL